jgi:4-amino-4-deoxy-L-arabinose transferase-like glycosyltransferase
MKLNRRSGRCQRNQSISKMSLCVYLMQPLYRSPFLSDNGMTLALLDAPPAKSTPVRITRTWNAALIYSAALLVFGLSLRADHFVDEDAYITQSYYADLFFTRQFNHELWLDMPAIDLQPLPKYMIGTVFRLANLPMPGRADAWKWYANYQPFGGPSTLLAARLPIIPLGALGCLALFACGVIVKDRRMGTIAALLLMINPLYSLQAHRAMADVPCEAFMLSLLAIWLTMWVRISGRGAPVVALLLPWLAGCLGGLSLLCTLNGFLGLGIVTAWCGLTWLLPRLSIGRKLAVTGATMVTVALALVLAVAANPYFRAKPAGRLDFNAREHISKSVWQRFLYQVELRLEISNTQKRNFPNDALTYLPEKTGVILVQGFGRFGPFGPRVANSKKRYDLRQDWGALLWLPLVCFGLFESIRMGLAQLRAGKPPAALALVVWAVCAWVLVTLYLPMAWDRYQLPIQSGNALLAAVGLSALWERLVAAVSSRHGPGEGYLSAQAPE